jgi:nicotinamide mononucleotide transporter
MQTQTKANKLKSFLKSFTPYQITYLITATVLVIVMTAVFPDLFIDQEYRGSTVLIIFCIMDAISNPVCELLIAKQSKWNFIVSVLFVEVSEIVICLILGWYATAFVTLLFWIPIDIISFIKWHKHPDKNDDNLTVVKRLKPWQTALMTLGIVAFGLGIGTLLTYIPGAADSYLDAFAAAVGMANGILLLFRYSEQWIAWLITVIITIFLDISGGMYILLITEGAMLINTIYGMVKWYNYTKKDNLIHK